MRTIKKNITSEYVIQKSKFIAKIYYVSSEEMVNDILNQLKNEYKDATHICYSYIIDNIKRFQDDGEPAGTAGMPILNVLEKKELNLILAVVIRYFGGIKLGAGGLVRAYSNATIQALNSSILGEIKNGIKIKINCDYENLKHLDLILKDAQICSKDFNEKITITFITSINNYLEIKDKLTKYNPTIIKENLYFII